MRLSTKGRYALRVMLDIAQNEKFGYVSISSISERNNISNKYLEQIISKLVKSKLLKAARGQTGGYMLNKKASEITMGDILRAAEGPLQVVDCINNPNCPLRATCKAYEFWQGMYDMIINYSNACSLEDLLKK